MISNKENDILLNVLANEKFSASDFQAVGLNAGNTSLLSEEDYKRSDKIKQNEKFLTDGKFDDAKFHEYYVGVAQLYNQLSLQDYDKTVMDLAQYSMDNIWVDLNKRTIDNRPKLTKAPNENLVTNSLIAVGKKGPQTLSQREIAQTQKVYNTKTDEWTDAPNDSWWGYLDDTLVIATYDEDEYDENGQLIHQKGQRKLNDEGLPYYETLGGRNVYGKQVLNKLDTLTTDGSSWNKFDFFDSDDIEQKSTIGTIMRNAALVGSMFIPYVGPVVRGLSVASQAAGLLATLGKVAVGNDNELLNSIQGWAKTVNRNNQTDYAAQNTWCMENFINMIGDTAGQLAEQRFLFEYAPALIKGSGRDGWKVMAGGAEGQKAVMAKKAEQYLASSKKVTDFIKDNGVKVSEIDKLHKAFSAVAQKEGQKYVDDIIKSHQKIGEVISKAYMTGLTVQDTYGEAKAAGASDLEAALLTIGYAAAEVQLLNSDLGNWILPELKGDKFRNKAIFDGLTKTRQKLTSAISGEASKEAKRNFAQKFLDLGKKLFNGDVARQAMESGTHKGLKVIGAHALGEAFEETSEELLADFSKSALNAVRWLRGADSLDMGQWDNMLDRYGMSALGGFFGGGITSAATDFSVAKQLSNMNQTEAMQELLYIVNNGKEEEFLKSVEKMHVDDKNLSAYEPIKIDGETVAWAEAKEGEDRDTVAKQLVRKQINTIKDILTTERARISTDSLLNRLAGADSQEIIGDIVYGKLRESRALKLFAQDYQLMQDDLIKAKADLIAAEYVPTDNSEVVDQDKVRVAKENYKAKQEAIKRYLEGNIIPSAVRNALFEINSSFHDGFDLHLNKQSYSKYKTGINYEDLSDAQKEEVDTQYEAYLNTQASDDIHIAASAFQDMIETSTPDLLEYAERIKTELQQIDQTMQPINYVMRMSELLAMDPQDIAQAQGLESIDQEQYLSWINANLQSLNQGMYEVVGLTDQNIIQQSLAIQEDFIEGDEKSKEKANQRHLYFINDAVFDRLDSQLQPLLQVGHIHPELKQVLLQLLRKQRRDTVYLADRIMHDSWAHQSIPEDVNPFQENNIRFNIKKTYDDRANVLTNYIQQIENIPNTPVLQLLDKFKSTSVNADVSISKHLKETQELLDGSMNELDDFIQQEDWEIRNDEAIKVINSFIAVIEGMKTDASDFDNPTGFTLILNKISRKHGVQDYVDLAELDSQTADIIIQDAKTLKNKLIFARNLSDNNKGQKLKQQDRVAGRKNIILFNKYKALVNVIPDRWVSQDSSISAKDYLHAKIDEAEHLKTFAEQGLIKLNKEQKYLAAKELQTFEDALFDVFNLNKKADGTFDEDTLAVFIEELAGEGGFFQKTGDLLLESSTDIDMNSFIWHVATRAIMRTSDYLGAYQKALTPEIAAIASQELAVQFGVAALTNMPQLNQWINAYKKAITNVFNNKLKTPEERKAALKRWAPGQDIFANKLFKYFASHDSVPQFLNTIFIEGGPGTGKSGGVFNMITKVAKQIDPDILDKAMFIHATDKSAKIAGSNLGINNYKGRQAFLEWISSQWKDTSRNKDDKGRRFLYDDSYTFNEAGQLVNTWKLNEYSESELPKFIFIDEISHYNQQELSMIEQFARANGIVVLTAGDLDQDRQIVYIKNPVDAQAGPITVTINRNYFPRVPKLGLSLRTRNRQQTNNTVLMQTYLTARRHGETTPPIKLSYLNNHAEHPGLFGTRVQKELNEATKQTIKLMIDTLKPNEKIGFMYYSEDTELYKYLMENFQDKIDPFLDSDAQGLEGQYYIVEINPNLINESRGGAVRKGTDEFFSRLYTGITRAEQGALVIADEDSVQEVYDKVYAIESFTETAIQTSAKNREEEIVRQLQEVDVNPLSINYLTKETLDIQAMEDAVDEEEELLVPDVIVPDQTPERIDEGYTSQDKAQKVVEDFFYDVIGGDLTKVQAIDNETSTIYDIEQLYVKEEDRNGTKIYIPTITLKKDGNLFENTLDNFIKDFSIVKKDTDEAIPLYSVGDFITIIRNGIKKNIQIKNIKTSEGIIYEVSDVDSDETFDITQSDLQNSFINFYVPGVKPDPRKPVVVDTGLSNQSDEEVRRQLNFLNRDPIQFDDTENLTQFLYTHAIHEVGGISDDEGNFIPSVMGTKRIDNGNGLLKLLGIKSFQEMKDVLGEIRGKAFHLSDDDLVTYFKKLFGDKVSDLEIDWAFKSSSADNKNREKDYQIFAVHEHEDETLEYIHVKEENRAKAIIPQRKKLMLRVKSGSKYVFEVSVASLNSPITVLLRKDNQGNYLYQDLLNKFNEIKQETKSDYKAIKAVIDTYYENRASRTKAEQDLLELCKFWLFTSDGIFPMSKTFNLAEQHGTGPIYTMQKGNNQLNGELQTTSELINLSEYAENKSINISSVMMSSEGKIDDLYDDRIYPGLPFVLISDNPDFATDDTMEEQYVKQVRAKRKGTPIKEEVRIKYITLPKVGVREWLFNKNALYRKRINPDDSSIETFDIGDDFTVYRVLDTILKTGKSLSVLNSSYGHVDLITKYLKHLQDIETRWDAEVITFNNKEEESKYNSYKETIGEKRARRKMKLSKQLAYLKSSVDQKKDRVVTGDGKTEDPKTTVYDRLIAFTTKAVWRTPAGASKAEFNETNLNTIVRLAKEGGFDSVRFQLKYSNREDISSNIGQFIRAEVGENKYSLGNIKIGDVKVDTNFKINSRIDTSIFITDQLSKEITDFNTRYTYKDGAYQFLSEYYTRDILPYIGKVKKSKNTEKPEESIGTKVKNKYNKYAKYFKKEILNNEEYDTEEKMLTALAQDISKTNGKLAVVYGGNLYIIDFKDSNGENLLIENFNHQINQDEVEIKVNRNGETRRGTLLPIIVKDQIQEFQLQLYELEDISTSSNLNITEDMIDAFKESLEEMRNDPFSIDYDKLFQEAIDAQGNVDVTKLNVQQLKSLKADIQEYESALAIKLSDLINALQNQESGGSNIEIEDSVQYQGNYYTVTAVNGSEIVIENQDTKEQKTVNLEDVKKEIVDCNPVKLIIKND